MKEFDSLFERFKFYHNIHYRADVVKIANLSNVEKIVSILTIIESGGIDYIINKMSEIKDIKMISSLLVILAPYEQDFCIKRYNELVASKDAYILALEPYGSENIKSIDFQKKNREYYTGLLNKRKVL